MSEDFLGSDLKIDPDTRDLVLDPQGEPELVKGRACLGQDLRHRVTIHPEVLGFLGRDLLPGEVRDLTHLLALEAERDPRVVKRSARARLLAASVSDGLTLELSVLPIGSDKEENLVVRVGEFEG